MNINSMMDKIPPKYRKMLTMILGSLGILFVVYIVVGDGNSSEKRYVHKPVKHILTDKNTRKHGVDAVAAKVKRTDLAVEKLVEEIEDINYKLSEEAKRSGTAESVSEKMDAVIAKLDKFERENRKLKNEITDLKKKTVTGPNPNKDKSKESKVGIVKPLIVQGHESPEEYFKGAPAPKSIASGEKGKDSAAKKQMNFVEVASEEVVEAQEQITEKSKAKDDEGIYIPTGSIIRGVLINGMDAPTGRQARRDPFPVSLRIQHEAILPNHFRANIRECFLILGGYGDLSSERAYLRTETISCVREDGKVVEASMKGYATGEDGKAGVRGRLVSKQGQMIARAAVAGFMGAVSESFDVSPVPVLDTSGNNNGDIQWQDAYSSDALQSGVVGGMSNAMDRVAQFYVDMAENIYPVIEIDAGREIEVILTSGTSLKTK